jgi:hypothetical protein
VTRRRQGCTAFAALVATAFAGAQAARADSVGDQLSAARLGSGYAQMLNLAATPDVSAARYDVDTRPATTINVVRLPYETTVASLMPGVELLVRAAVGYMSYEGRFPVDIGGPGTGAVDAQWSAASLTGGLGLRVGLGSGWSFLPALDFSVARLENRASYVGSAGPLAPLFDGRLFNWGTDATLVTPNAGLQWLDASAARVLSLRGHVAWSSVRSHGTSDPVLAFDESASAWSVRAERLAPTGIDVFGMPLDWAIVAGAAGFFGPNRDILGFSHVAELGAALEIPVSRRSPGRLRVGASALAGQDVSGWTVSLGMRF